MLHEWAMAWGVPLIALQDLEQRLGRRYPATASQGKSESAVQANIRIEAAQLVHAGRRIKLFRNNVGALEDKRGIPVRYGLANDSAAMNKVLKSGDLIGWETITITPEMVGREIAQFLSAECKEEGWRYTATAREVAQNNWALTVLAGGGRALFVNGPGQL